MMTKDLKKLVTLMEDEDDIARLIAHILESNGFRTHRPARPSTLILEAVTNPPALFILDLMLPEVDGFRLCRDIRMHPSLQGIPILILTAKTGAEDRKRALASGADSYITKPFAPSALIATAQGLCERNLTGKTYGAAPLVWSPTIEDSHRTPRRPESKNQ